MENPLDRKPLAERLADKIESAVRAGRWNEELPGYRLLAEEFAVSWRTSRSALQILEKRGVIHPFERGKPRRIRPVKIERDHSSKNLLIITSSTTLHDIAELELLDGIILTWVKTGGGTRQTRVDYRRHNRPASSLRKLITSYNADVIVIREPSKPWVDAARSLPIPVFFLGGDIPVAERSTVSGLGVSIIEMVAATVKRLRQLGHERILIPDEGFGPMIRDAILTGLRYGYGDEADPPPLDICCPIFAEVEPETWQSYWTGAFQKFHPTAAIVRKESSYLSLFGYCYDNGIKIPEDLSIVCHSASENLLWCHPQPDHTTFPLRRAISFFRRWIDNGFPLTGMRIFPVEFIEAGTVRQIAKSSRK